VAKAIYDHYKPENMEDSPPKTAEGAALSVADKLVSLSGSFRVGNIPKGSKDPYGLRRAAQGVIKILAEHRVNVPLDVLIGNLEGKKEIRPFLDDRLRFYLREIRGFAYDEINAVLATGADRVPDIIRRLEALKAVRPTPDFEPLCAAFKRIRNILAHHVGEVELTGPPLSEGPERDLYSKASLIFNETVNTSDYETILRRAAELRPAVDLFFEKVLVMDPDESVRRDRLARLSWLRAAFTRVADFSEIVTSGQ
jgi:glycyl-tRNA synthetase beta chain